MSDQREESHPGLLETIGAWFIAVLLVVAVSEGNFWASLAAVTVIVAAPFTITFIKQKVDWWRRAVTWRSGRKRPRRVRRVIVRPRRGQRQPALHAGP